jgi:hypothetical protein
VLYLSTTPWRRMGEWMYSSTHSLTSALDGGEWPASRPSRFTPRERAPGTHRIGGWVGPRAILEAVVNMTTLKYMVRIVRNQNCISEEIEGKLNSGLLVTIQIWILHLRVSSLKT